jgi:hypothetical protein
MGGGWHIRTVQGKIGRMDSSVAAAFSCWQPGAEGMLDDSKVGE